MPSSDTAFLILVVDDEWLIAASVAATLAALGHAVVGPAPSVEEALRLIEQDPPDGALLDISLGAQKSFPVAEALDALDVPYAFVSGYAQDQLPARFASRPLLQKPIGEFALKTWLSSVIRRKS